MMKLDGHVAIVTGSASKRGIGRAVALVLAEQGAAVAVADIDMEGVGEAVTQITSRGGRAMGVQLDVTDQQSVDAMIDQVIKRFGRIDILVNNAGISQRLPVEEMGMPEVQKMFDVNFFGMFRCVKGVLEHMKAHNYGRIINLASVAGKQGGGYFGGAHYSASKAAVLGFTKNLAREVALYGITANCVTPGLISTEIWQTLDKADIDKIVDGIPMARPGQPSEVAPVIAFLASQEASYITGEDIDVNGGSYMD